MTFLINFFLEPRFKVYFVSPVSVSASKSQLKLSCNITSHFKPSNSDIYLLKNGFKKVHLSEDQTSISTASPVSYNSFLQYEMHSNYSAQGYYQCAVFTPEFMTKEVRSKKLQLQFPGNIFPLQRTFNLKHCNIPSTDLWVDIVINS